MFPLENRFHLGLLFISLLALLLFTCAGCSVAKRNTNGAGTVTDSNLEKALREQLGKSGGALAAEDWAGLETVKILGCSIGDLQGLQNAVNLRELNLRRNKIADLTPLSGLSRLETLILADNEIEDISGLNGAVLSGLKQFDLSINRISELAVLDWDRLKSLTHLDIRYNYIDLQDQAVREVIADLEARGAEVLFEPMY